jgi:prepilin peptidase CpaA
MPVASQVLLLALVVAAAVYDILFRRIANWLVITALAVGLSLNVFLFEWAGLKTSLLGVALAFAVYFPMYLLRGMGAGDVKLMTAVGAIVGPGTWFAILIFTGVIGGLTAVALLLVRGRLRHTFWNVGFLLSRILQFKPPYANTELDVRSAQGIRLPHGALIALGTLAFITATRLFP